MTLMKEFFRRAIIGAMGGVVICNLISIIISYAINDGHYYPVTPQLSGLCGGETNGAAVQMAGVMIYGAVMAGISVIWDMEKWSLTRQTATHLLVCMGATVPAAYLLHWIEHSIAGVLGYCGIFLAIYAIIWLTSYIPMKKRIKQINERMGQLNVGEAEN